MGVRTNNIKNLLRDARSRTIIVITFAALLIAMAIGYFVFQRESVGPKATATVAETPGVTAVPTGTPASPEYAALVEKENLIRAQQAAQSGGSAIPTIVKAVRPGEAQTVTQAEGQPWQAGLGFQQLSQSESGTPKFFAIDAVRQSHCDPKDVAAALKLGVTLQDFRNAGCTVEQLEKAGFNPDQLQKSGYSACDVVGVKGITPKAMKDAGYSAGELHGVGYNACQLKAAGFTPVQLLAAGFSPEELKGVGFAPEQVAAGGAALPTTPAGGALATPYLPTGTTAAALKAAGCTPEAVRKARAAGVNAAAMRAIGCSAKDLKAGGYLAQELKAAGFSPGELRAAAFMPAELRDAGFNPTELRNAGFSPLELKNAGIEGAPLQPTFAGLPPGVTGAALQAADCGKAALQKAKSEGVSAAILKQMGCSPAQLRAGGYTAAELKDAGLTAGELNNAGVSVAQLKNVGYSPRELSAAGLAPEPLQPPSEMGISAVTPIPVQTIPVQPIITQPPVVPRESARLAEARAQQEAIANQAQLQQNQQVIQSAMATQVSQLFAAWASPTQVLVPGERPEKTLGGAEGVAIAGGGAAGVGKGPPIIKAGTIMYAVMTTSVNSDYPGPVLATIVSGRYKDTRLIGSLTTFPPFGKAVMLSFTMMNSPLFSSTVPINAVAISPDTARTALSDYTNYHYLIRFGTLFATSFLEGYGQALLQSGQSIISTSSSTTVTSPTLKPKDKSLVALGNVGNKFGSLLEPYYNMPPTVHVYSGTGVGILFLEDVPAPLVV